MEDENEEMGVRRDTKKGTDREEIRLEKKRRGQRGQNQRFRNRPRSSRRGGDETIAVVPHCGGRSQRFRLFFLVSACMIDLRFGMSSAT